METKDIKLLILDDEKIALKNLTHIMKKENYDVTARQDSKKALQDIETKKFDIVITDLKMDKIDGMQILQRVKEISSESEVIMITGYATVESAIEAMKKGAYDYILKPFKIEEVREVVKKAIEKILLKKENERLKKQIESYQDKIHLITNDTKMKKMLELAKQIAPTLCNVLITGESGTGKEVIARYIHSKNNRSNSPFFAINCGAFPTNLLANELFGHEKGAFTGATGLKKGLIEMASRGTLFLDEITEMSSSMQANLLRVIQEKELLRLGATSAIKVDVRFIAATNIDLKNAVKEGFLRSDLYFRLNVVSFHIPPLSERKSDIMLLAYYFLKKYSNLMNKEITEFSPEVTSFLLKYDFPGNVRELENIIERGVALSNTKTIETSHLSEELKDTKSFQKDSSTIPTLKEQEKYYIEWVLKKMKGNQSKAAKELGIDRVSLWRKINKYSIEIDN